MRSTPQARGARKQELAHLGRVKFYGEGCNACGDGAGTYSLIIDGLQPGEQPLSITYALGQCEMQYRLYPPED